MTAQLPDADEIRRVACFTVGGIGDVICQTPTIEAIRERYPHATLTAIVRGNLRELADLNPHVDDVILFDATSVVAFMNFALSIRRRRFDLWVDLHVPTFNTVRSNHKDFFRNASPCGFSGRIHRNAIRSFSKRSIGPVT